jgi:peptidoglycan-associated lipoprotein
MNTRHVSTYWLQLSLTALLVIMVCTGCKKNVASVPPTAPIQPMPPPPAPEITLRASTTAVDQGQPVALQWESKNASTVRIEPELGSVQTRGSRLVNPSSSVSYVATAIGPGGSAADSVRVTVRVPSAAGPAPRAESRPVPNVTVDALFRQNVQPIYFDYDQSEIRPDQVSRLNANVAWLREHPGVKFTIEGNCDDRGSEEYNLGLGDRRANRVKEFLLKEGVEASRIKVLSYGEERPICSDETEDCYQRNRRAAFVLGPNS